MCIIHYEVTLEGFGCDAYCIETEISCQLEVDHRIGRVIARKALKHACERNLISFDKKTGVYTSEGKHLYYWRNGSWKPNKKD